MAKRIVLFAAAVCLVFSVFLQPSYGVYIWVDDKGITHMTDYPKPSQEPEQQAEEPAPSGVPIEQDVAPVEMKQVPEQAVSPLPPVEPKTTPLPVSAVTPTPVVMQAEQATASVPTVTPQQVGQTPITLQTTSPQPIPLQEMPDLDQEPHPMPLMDHQPQTTLDPALLAGLGMVLLVAFVVLYIYCSLCLYLIAKKLAVPAAWTAWVPLAQLWAFVTSAGKSPLWILLLFIPLVSAIIGIYLWMCITENLGRNKWLGLLMLVPIVNLIFLGVLAFSESEAQQS